MRGIVVLLILLHLIVLSAFPQNQRKADSLMNIRYGNDLSIEDSISLLLNIAYNSSPINAIKYANEALALSIKTDNLLLQAQCCQNIAYAQNIVGDNVNAIQSALKALALYNKLGKSGMEASIDIQLGTIFIHDSDFQNALKYLRRGLSIYETKKDTCNIALTLINLGESYRLMNVRDSAFYCFQQSLFLNQKLKDDIVESYNLGNLGMLFVDSKDYTKAREYFTRSLAILERLGDPYSVSVYKSELAKILYQEGKTADAIKLLKECLNLAISENLKEQIRDFSLQLSQYLEVSKKFDESLRFRKQYELYNDSIHNIESVRKMEQLQSKHELDKKQDEIVALNKINLLQRRISIGMAISSVLFFVLASLLFFTYRRVKKANVQITHQKMLVEKREKEKAILLKELNHRVKNNLQMVSSLLSLQSRQLKGHPAAEALLSGKSRVEALALIHQKLYRDDVDIHIDLKEYIEELTENLIHNFNGVGKVVYDLQPFVMNIDKVIPLGLILNELLTNSLKYGSITPEIFVGIEKNDKYLVLTVKDDGIGLKEDFNWQEAKSFGLKLVHSLVSQLSGEINYSTDGGAKWQVVLNVDKLL
jgi:two-component system, sensor histidine kinase PdtaS